jgi:hypothetical protein
VPPPALTKLLFVEPHAHLRTGHWQGALQSLVRAAVATGVEVTAVSVEGVDDALRQELGAHGCRCLSLDSDGSSAVKLGVRALVSLEATARTSGLTRLSRDLAALRRATLEAGIQQVARRSGTDAVIVLSAGNAFPALAAGPHRTRVPQLRVVHDVDTVHTPGLRLIHALRTRRTTQVTWMTTTPALGEALARQGLDARVLPFSTRERGDYLTASERAAARDRFGIPPDGWCIGLLGGWWHDKDMETVVAAFERLPAALTVIVAGEPLDVALTERVAAGPGRRVVVIHRALCQEEIRAVYAASDLTVVSRHQGVVKESGVIMDAARLGVPVLFSDQDPHLNDVLARSPWARAFAAGSAASLADALLDVHDRPLPRPAPDDAERLGLRTPTEMVEFMVRVLADPR